MESFDTGKIHIESKSDFCIHLSFYADGEVKKQDIRQIRQYLLQAEGKVTCIVTRDGEYWLSASAQKMLFQQATESVTAVAYVDTNQHQQLFTYHVSQTYLSGIHVKSCRTMEHAHHWLKRFDQQ